MTTILLIVLAWIGTELILGLCRLNYELPRPVEPYPTPRHPVLRFVLYVVFGALLLAAGLALT